MAETLPELLRERDRFLLSGHENPDGDCVGAQAALFHLLKALGKQVVILNPDPLARSFDFLLRHTPFESYRNEAQLPPHDVVVLLDCSQLSRLGNLGPKLRAGNPTVAVIDHHVGSDHGDGSVNFVDSNAPSTGAMVHRLYGMMGVPLSAEAAEGVFLTLVSDTGWFRHSNTSPDVLSLSAEMARQGVDISGMFDLLYRRMHQDSVAVMGQALAQASFRLKGRYGVVVMDRQLMDRAGRAGFDPDLVMEPVRSVEGIEVVAMFKERLDGVIKLSLRATRDVDVQRIAASFGGGGHKKAAGATLRVSMAEAMRQVEALVAAALPAGGGGR